MFSTNSASCVNIIREIAKSCCIWYFDYECSQHSTPNYFNRLFRKANLLITMFSTTAPVFSLFCPIHRLYYFQNFSRNLYINEFSLIVIVLGVFGFIIFSGSSQILQIFLHFSPSVLISIFQYLLNYKLILSL